MGRRDRTAGVLSVPVFILNGMLFLLLAGMLYADTPYDQQHGNLTITSDTTWVPGGNPYVVCGTVTVNSQVTLSVAPGTIVKFDFNDSCINPIDHVTRSQIYVAGTFKSNGAAGPNPKPSDVANGAIVFTSTRDNITQPNPPPVPSPGDWQGIVFSEGSSGGVTNSLIEFAAAGVQINGPSANPAIQGNTFSWDINGVYIKSGKGVIQSNSFDHIESGINAAKPNYARHSE